MIEIYLINDSILSQSRNKIYQIVVYFIHNFYSGRYEFYIYTLVIIY